MAGRKPLPQREKQRRINLCKTLYEQGKSKREISNQSGFSCSLVNFYIQGYGSEKEYQEEVQKTKQEYKTLIDNRGISTPSFELHEVKITKKGISLKTHTGHKDLRPYVKMDLESTLESIDLKRKEEHKFSYNYKTNGVSIFHHNLKSRAFLEAYAEKLKEL